MALAAVVAEEVAAAAAEAVRPTETADILLLAPIHALPPPAAASATIAAPCRSRVRRGGLIFAQLLTEYGQTRGCARVQASTSPSTPSCRQRLSLLGRFGGAKPPVPRAGV